MNCTQAKNIKITDILASEPVYRKNESAWYISPFRDEKEASFQVNETKNVWFDHGEGVGGDVMDLVCKMNLCNMTEALKILSGNTIAPKVEKVQKPIAEKNKLAFNFESYLRIEHIEYAQSRGIEHKLVEKYCKTVFYTNQGRDFYSIGFGNSRGGWELRSEGFKGCIAPKFYTLVKGESSERCNVFEGFFNFLSLLQYEKKLQPKFDTIILNSLSMLNTVDFSGYEQINSFLDNDQSGIIALRKLEAQYPTKNFSGKLYPNFKDFNEYLLKRKI